MERADEIWNHGTDLMDDDGEIRELALEDFASMKSFAELPREEQEFLRGLTNAKAPRPSFPVEEVRLKLSQPVLERFRASGTGWEERVDEALREWIAEHQAS